MSQPSKRRSRGFALKLLLALAVLAGLDQAVAFFALGDGEVRGIRVAPFDPPRFHAGSDREWERLAARLEGAAAPPSRLPFDPELGWAPIPGSEFELYAYDDQGARLGNPQMEEPLEREILVYGCSFTHGDEVTGPEAWPAVLERSLGDSRVRNFGVSAFGLDQALLRLRQTAPAFEADEIWMALMPTAALRATTCYRPLVRPWSNALAFKPRFGVAGSDRLDLELVPCPARSPAEVVRLGSDASFFLERLGEVDPWVEACPAAFAPRGSRLSHRTAVGRLWLSWRVRSAPEPLRALAGPGAQAFEIQRAIVFNAKREAEALGARFRFLILPSWADLEARSAEDREEWQPFLSELQGLGIECLDVSEAIRSLGRSAFTGGAGSHYSPAGNRIVAEVLAAAARN